MILRTQDPKYAIEILHIGNKDGTGHVPTARIVNFETKEPIPDDEPVFLLRAKDKRALGALFTYQERVPLETQKRSVDDRILAFQHFAGEHPERMREPT